MIFNIPRHLLFLFLFSIVISVEHSVGLPIISLLFASIYLAPTGRVMKTIGLVWCGVLLATSYLIPFWVGVGAVAILILCLERQAHFFHSETMTFLTGTLLSALAVGVVAKIPFPLSFFLYHGVLVCLSVFFIRWWFIKKMGKRQAI